MSCCSSPLLQTKVVGGLLLEHLAAPLLADLATPNLPLRAAATFNRQLLRCYNRLRFAPLGMRPNQDGVAEVLQDTQLPEGVLQVAALAAAGASCAVMGLGRVQGKLLSCHQRLQMMVQQQEPGGVNAMRVWLDQQTQAVQGFVSTLLADMLYAFNQQQQQHQQQCTALPGAGWLMEFLSERMEAGLDELRAMLPKQAAGDAEASFTAYRSSLCKLFGQQALIEGLSSSLSCMEELDHRCPGVDRETAAAAVAGLVVPLVLVQHHHQARQQLQQVLRTAPTDEAGSWWLGSAIRQLQQVLPHLQQAAEAALEEAQQWAGDLGHYQVAMEVEGQDGAAGAAAADVGNAAGPEQQQHQEGEAGGAAAAAAGGAPSVSPEEYIARLRDQQDAAQRAVQALDAASEDREWTTEEWQQLCHTVDQVVVPSTVASALEVLDSIGAPPVMYSSEEVFVGAFLPSHWQQVLGQLPGLAGHAQQELSANLQQQALLMGMAPDELWGEEVLEGMAVCSGTLPGLGRCSINDWVLYLEDMCGGSDLLFSEWEDSPLDVGTLGQALAEAWPHSVREVLPKLADAFAQVGARA
jgi:hypothetical protein